MIIEYYYRSDNQSTLRPNLEHSIDCSRMMPQDFIGKHIKSLRTPT